jgi:hypothetical protein
VSSPLEADPKLIVDSDTVLSSLVAAQFFQAISGRNPQVIERLRIINHCEFSPRDCSGWRTTGLAGAPDFRRLLVGESLDHFTIVTISVNNVNRY